MDSHAVMGIKPREKNEMAQVERGSHLCMAILNSEMGLRWHPPYFETLSNFSGVNQLQNMV